MSELMVLEKLFHEDQPMGGVGTETAFIVPCAEECVAAQRVRAVSVSSLASLPVGLGWFFMRDECNACLVELPVLNGR